MVDERKTEIRPVYSMDVMRLVVINELSKTADTFYIQMEQGARQQIIPFRATLKVLWSKIKRFVTDKYPDIKVTSTSKDGKETTVIKGQASSIIQSFLNIDNAFDFDHIEKNDEEKFIMAKNGLIEMRELFDQLIDEIWTKVYEILPEEDRARLYSLGRA